MRLFDAHCHLQDPRLAGRLDGVLSAARAAGVTDVLCCGVAEEDWAGVLDLAARFPGVVPALGLHPWRIAARSREWLATLRRLLEENSQAAVGEIGLDHAVRNRDDDGQRAVFMAQLELASELGRPVSVHCRQAWDALRSALATVGPLPAGFAVHAYSGSVETLSWLLDAGAHISFAGTVVADRNRRARQALAATPGDRLLIETDAPDLRPCMPGREPAGRRAAEEPNEPALLPVVARAAADVRGVDPSALAACTRRNAWRLFRPGDRPEEEGASCHEPV